MKKKERCKVFRGFLGSVSGVIANLKVSKNGVIYVNEEVKKKKPKQIEPQY